ncbi:glycosyltransferase [Parablastomonas sp. CN1-191]|uniref:glycosyltransferase n=1 Tax=Parablastomonas sp. CN1-191 TaxID=3400908 RepID=UPI003BF82F18
MKLSVVTNAFNQAAFLREAVESVLAQEGFELEYILVDPGSKDGTADVIAALEAEYPGRFTVLREPDDGPADGLNRGFARATGDWFYYLNGDDYLLPGAFAEAARAIARHPDAGAITADCLIVDGEGRPTRVFRSREQSPRANAREVAYAAQQSTFYRAAAYRRIGGFNAANKSSWDGEILLDLMLAGFEVVTVRGIWSAFRIYSTSITGSGRLEQLYKADMARNFERVFARPPRKSDQAITRLQRALYRVRHPLLTVERLLDTVRPRRHAHLARPARP